MRAWLVTLHMSLFNLLQKVSSVGITICFIRNVPEAMSYGICGRSH